MLFYNDVVTIHEMMYFYHMIIVRQKASTLVSLSIFIILCFIGTYFGTDHFFRKLPLQWYDYIFIFLCFPVGMGLVLRLLWNYKSVFLGKGKIRIHYPIRFTEKIYPLNAVKRWTEEKVKTPTGTYKELTIMFRDGKKIAISMQEHLSYREAHRYLQKKCKRKNNH